MAKTKLTRKERILRLVQRLPDDVTYAEVIDRLDTLKDIEVGLEQIERGEYITHEELEKKLREEGWLDEPDSSGPKKRSKLSTESAASSATATPRRRRARSQTGS
jgi:hypothetical protein